MRYRLPYIVIKWLYRTTERKREKRYKKLKDYLLPPYDTPKDLLRVNQLMGLIGKYRFYYLTASEELQTLKKECARLKEENRYLLDKVKKLQP